VSKGTYRRQSCIARTNRVVPFGLEMREEIQHQGRIDIAQCQHGRWLARCASRIVQQELEGIAIGSDCSRADVLLLDQALGEEALEQRAEFRGRGEQGVHDVSPCV
jgi:hypothetical protein